MERNICLSQNLINYGEIICKLFHNKRANTILDMPLPRKHEWEAFYGATGLAISTELLTLLDYDVQYKVRQKFMPYRYKSSLPNLTQYIFLSKVNCKDLLF